MRSLIAASLLLASDAVHEETSLMQGMVAQRAKLAPEKSSRKDNTAKLMETATAMLKNGVTPDVVQFIETTITEVNSEVLGAIVDEHHRDQGIINAILDDFDAAIAEMEACAETVRGQHAERELSSHAHQLCRSDEAIKCARSRKCEEELEELWERVKIEEEEMRRIHWAIHGEWCEGSAPGHPSLADPFQWQIGESWEGPETSQSTDPYPAIDLAPDVIEFRRFSVEYFGLYIEQKPRVELAWENYNRKLLECAALEETWTLKVDECDEVQDTLHGEACAHGSANRQCAATFGHRYHMTMVEYISEVARIRELEYDRKREWETLHIVTCLLETVYTHVIHSIDSGEPCPTTESHPEQTAAEVNYCHVLVDTANLTIDYGTPPTPPELPPVVEPPCTAQYIYDETGSFSFEIQASHAQAIADEGLESYFTVLSAYGWAGCAAPKACTPCDSVDLVVDPDYVEHDGCDYHQAHMQPGQMDLDSFKCLSGDQCIRSEGRCNGVNNCDDGSDEQGCDTTWGTPAVMGAQECQDPFTTDTQFRCGDNTCTHIAGRCNGVNNCADGSDEQGCATTTTGLTIEAMTGYTATIETPAVSSQVFYDRTYTFDSLGAFTGHSFIKMSNEDKHIRNSHVQMKLRLPAPMTIYVNKLETTELSWLEAEGWTHSGLEGVSYHGVRQTRHTDWSGNLVEDHYGPSQVWEKTFPAGVVTMRGNHGGDGSYVMFVANAADAPEEPEPTVCPAGWTQVGEAGADIGGCGLQSCGERYWSQSPTECAAACAARADCQGFNWAPMGGDRNHEAMTVCTLYNAAAPTSTWWGSAGHVQIFCVPVSLWSQHLSDRMKCNNNVNMQYVSDQAACQALAIANGHPFYSFRHNGESQGHKCMSSAHCDEPLDERTNEWMIYTDAPPLCPGVDTTGEWTVAVGAATSAHAGLDVGQECFNAMFAACPVVRYTNAPMAGSPAIYVRHSGSYGGDAHALFTYLWAHADNEFHTDFDIYSNMDDARSGSNPWSFCNFSDQPQPNHFTVGFPRDCGPTGYQPHIWFHATRASGTQSSGFFEVFTGSNCPAH